MSRSVAANGIRISLNERGDGYSIFKNLCETPCASGIAAAMAQSFPRTAIIRFALAKMNYRVSEEVRR
jgi:hypothetical protein